MTNEILPSFHAVSPRKLPVVRLRDMDVPPTATTFGEAAGYEVPGLFVTNPCRIAKIKKSAF